MATALVRGLTIDDAKIWRGGSRLIIGDSTTPPTFPVKLEDVITLSTMALASNWLDVGATTDDGVSLERTQDIDDGIAIDQRDYMLRPGRVSNVQMKVTATLMYTDIATIKKIWEAGTITATAAAVGPPVIVAQKRLAIGSPSSLTSRLVGVLQQNDSSGKLRIFAFRKGKFTESGALKISAKDTSMVDITLVIEADTSQTDGTDFGLLMEED